MKLIQKLKDKIRGRVDVHKLCKEGCIIGKNFNAQEGVIIDPGHCWLIEIGNNVTLAPNVHILAHDASMKKFIGYTRIAKTTIGNNVFIGAGSIVLPGVKIGDNIIVGSGSVITHDLLSGYVYVGNPAQKLMSLKSFINKHKKKMEISHMYDESFIIGKINAERKEKMKKELSDNDGYII